MKKWIILALLLIGQSADAATWYVRPAEDEYGSENGTSYANAFDGFADVAWGGANVKAGDTLYVCGYFDLDSVDGGALPMMQFDAGGSATGTLIIDGNCAHQGDLPQAILDGESTRARGIDSGSTADQYVTIRNILIKNFVDYGLIAQGVNTDFRGWRIENVDVEEIRDATGQGMDFRGTDVYIDENSSVTNIGQDGVYIEGDNFTAKLTCTNPSLDGVTGDCIQMDKQADNFLFDGVRCIHTTDAKQCIFVSTTGFTGSGIIRDSYCDGPASTATLHTCFFFEDLSGTVTAERNYGKESRYLLYAGGTTTLIARANIGHDFSARGIQCGTGTSNCIIINNTVANTDTCYSTESATGVSTIRNNIGVNCNLTGIQRNAVDIETNNVIFNASDPAKIESASTGLGSRSSTTSPNFIGGNSLTKPNDFRLIGTSTLTSGGVYFGDYKDFAGRPFEYFPTIGALQHTWRDIITNRPRRTN